MQYDINHHKSTNKTVLLIISKLAKNDLCHNYSTVTEYSLYLLSAQVKADVGDVDILVNNAGMVTGKQFLDSPDTLNVKTMEVNVMAHFWVMIV